MELPILTICELQVLNAIKDGVIVYCSDEERDYVFNTIKEKVKEDIFNIILDRYKADFLPNNNIVPGIEM